MTKKHRLTRTIQQYAFLFMGSIITAVGLEFFLIPNQIIDGGVVGLSIMASYLTGFPLSAFIVILNIPFLYLGYKQIGKIFALSTLFSVVSLSYWVSVFEPIPGPTNDVFLAAIFGGIIVGIGVGLIIRYGGSLDGTEIVAILLDKRTGFSVGEIVMFFNVFILSVAGLVFSWDKAMYSLVAYFVAFKVIDITIEGLDESKAVFIVTNQPDEVAEVILSRLGRGITVFYGEGGFSKEGKKIIYAVITRLEISTLKTIIAEIDDTAFVTINDVHDVMGGRFKKQAIH